MEPTLKLPKVAHRQPIIVGLNAIVGSKLYIVPVDEGTTVWVTWQVEWLCIERGIESSADYSSRTRPRRASSDLRRLLIDGFEALCVHDGVLEQDVVGAV
uniref:Uncharacterized protein n=1 Tax=Bionectria ochroleuca TaxID=29856 RepID=A0A0B7K8D4_BIOOC